MTSGQPPNGTPECCRDRHGWRALVDDLDTLDNTQTLITPRGPVTL